MLVNLLKNRNIWPDNLKMAVSLYEKLDVQNLEAGKHDLDGQNVFVLIMEMETKPSCEVRYEAHSQYIDIQILLEGSECLTYLPAGSEDRVIENLMKEKDVAFYKSERSASEVHLTPGMCVVFYPGELHKPGCISREKKVIRKAVIKVKQE